MYYEEKSINGIVYYRTHPCDTLIPISNNPFYKQGVDWQKKHGKELVGELLEVIKMFHSENGNVESQSAIAKAENYLKK